ncbi:hypothetical protein [Caenispirillum bisanense]|uniref:hypothetical protein n=1 Tax=Caenispirillum bisanense TaxID=414052 RepID=UPI0031CEC5E9
MSVVPLAGAEQRLLHPLVPVAFFGLALVAHLALWGIAVLFPAEVTAVGGPGPGLAAVHTLTLGVLVTTALGAVLQILPVTTQQTAPPPLLGWLVLAAVGGGGVLLVAGFLGFLVPLMVAGAGAAVVGLVLFAVLLARLLLRARASALADTLPAVWLALVCLLAVVVLGGLLAHDYRLSLLPDHAAAAATHAVLAAYGFMGFLVVGFSHVLVPMLAVAEPPPPGSGRPVLALAALGLSLAAGGLLLAVPAAVWAGMVAGFVAALLHVRLMLRTVAKRMRRKLGLSFVMIRASWALLPLSIVAGALVYAGVLEPEPFGVLLLPGWLLTLLLGILQRILPFLASMHTVRTCARPMSANALVWDVPLRLSTVCHPLALGLLLAAVVLALPPLAVAAGVAGAAGAASFLVYGITVARRARRHRLTVGPKGSGPKAAPPPRPLPVMPRPSESHS